MISVPKDSTEEPAAGAVPAVSGHDRIGAAEPQEPSAGLPNESNPSPGVIPPAPDRAQNLESSDIAPVLRSLALRPEAADEALSLDSVTITPPLVPADRPTSGPSGSLQDLIAVAAGIKSAPRLEAPRLEAPRMEPVVPPRIEPPALVRDEVAPSPPIALPAAQRPEPTPTVRVEPPPLPRTELLASATPELVIRPPLVRPDPDAPTIAVPPPPRAQMPPPLPASATPPAAPPPTPGSRKRLVGVMPERPPLPPQNYPMPSTIAPSEPARKRSNFRSKAARSSVVVVFDGVMSLATIVALILWVAAFAGREEFETPGPLAASKVVIIPPKKSREEIGDLLESSGVVSSSTVFVYGSLIAQVPDLKAGEYEFRPGQTMHEVADEIAQNKVVQHKITFPEGWTSEQIVERLSEDPVLAGKILAIPEEGSLLPDTYTFPRGETRQQILDIMHKALDRRLTDIWAHRNAELLRQLKVPKDLVILASIVEKETSKPDERARIAAVFVNRLNRNMRLETDPTILYGLYGGKAWTESRTITKADLVAPNPYNTYKINGLPPGPIGNPGRASLEAAANPSISNELFFVADGTGGHAFSETLDEHTKNVAKWREIERQRKLADPAANSLNPNALPAQGGGTGVLAAPALVTPVAPATPGTRPALGANPKPPTAQKPRPKAPPAPDQLPADTN